METLKKNPDDWNEMVQQKFEGWWDLLQGQFPPMQGESLEGYWERTRDVTFHFINQ